VSTTAGLRPPVATAAAYAAAVFFALHLATYLAPTARDATLVTAATIAVPLAVLAVAQHLLVFPVVATLPAAAWARVAAYAWLVGDMGTDLAQLAGAPRSIYLAVRLVVNVLAALWIGAAAWRAHGATRGIGVFVALDTAAYSALGPFVSWAFVVTLPSLVLLPIWFVLAGRRIDHLAVASQGVAER
jgi:hypothetical protein